jgi:hypothetical protein
MLENIRSALETVFSDSRNVAIAAASGLALTALNFLLPVLLVPGNTLEFQLALLGPEAALLYAVLAALVGIVVAMQAHIFSHGESAARGAAAGGFAFLSSVASGVFGGASCAACVSALFSFLGAGSTLFLVDHKAEFALLGLGLVAASLWFSSEKINGSCGNKCVPRRKA